MENENRVIKTFKNINWRSKSVIIALTASVFGFILLGIGQFFTLQQNPDATLIDYISSVALFTVVILAVPSAFSELGKVSGFSSEDIKKTLDENNKHFEDIGKNNWENNLRIANDLDNTHEKLRVLKSDTLNKLAKDPNNKMLQELKSNVMLYYNYLDTNDKDILEQLTKNNFDLDMFSIAYEHVEYNDLFGIQSSSISSRQRTLNINKILLKQAMIKRGIIIMLGGYMSAYGLLFGADFMSALMFVFQLALVAWTSYTTFNSAFGLVINELRDIIDNNNTFLKICLTKFAKAKEIEKTREPTQEEQEEIERKAEIKAEKIELKALEDAERKFEREFKIEERKMKHDLKMAEIRAKSEIAKAQLIASKTVEVMPTPIVKENVSANTQKVEVILKQE